MTEKAVQPDIRALDSLPDLVLVVDGPAMTILDVSRHAAAELGWSPSDLIGRPISDFGDPDGRDMNESLVASALDGETIHFDRRVRDGAGEWRTFNFSARVIDHSESRFVMVGREMDALAHSHSQLADLLKLADLTDDMFVVCDSSGSVTYANAATARTHGDMNFVGRNIADFLHEDDVGFEGIVHAVVGPAGRAEGRIMAKRTDGSPIMLGVRTVFDQETQRWFTVERDISRTIEQEREMERLATDLRRQATTDTLTGVANRYALNEALDEAVETGDTFALLLLDMDDFKSVNDTFGHAAGDEFLRCVAQRMQRAVKLTDMVARLGGDEFVVYLPGIDSEAAAQVADRMINAVGQDYSVTGSTILRSCSIGIAVWEPGESVSDVLRKADRAAYRAKHEGRSRYVVF